MPKQKLSNDDYCRAAGRLNCDVAAIKAVASVESRGNGFDTKDRPKILFERHKFAKYTNGKYINSHPHICNWTAGGYGPSSAQYDRFSEAFMLDPEAAMMSASWGKFQIMGFNFAVCGFKSVSDFVDAMKENEGRHLDAFVEFVVVNMLDDELRKNKWADFARGYNGPDYKKNQYDTKMAAAFKEFKAENVDCSKFGGTKKWTALRLNDTGPNVKLVQEGLVTELLLSPADVDGEFGPRTEMAIKAFQCLNGLKVDGVVGKVTRRKLLEL
ncbi:MAG: N-acetylmuramidase domain-containing protein [Acidobacteriota bacterium]|nr:N-acetylmuramidase domain-containing protein [Acidobacteriota bacterium]